MAQTLIEYGKTVQDDTLRGVIETFAATNPILEGLPFRSIQGNALAYNQESVLPGIAFRGINEAYAESVGVLLPATEKLKIMGGDADTDKFLIATNGEGRRAIDIAMKAKAASLYFSKIFIDGDEGVDAKQFDGLNQRIGTGTQRIYADAGSGAAGAVLSENQLQRLIDAIDGEPDLLLMGKKVRRQLTNLFKGSTLIAESQDIFGRRVQTFGGIPIRILDKDNTNGVILDMDETEGTSSGVCGSIYGIKFGTDQYLCGLQNAPLAGVDLGEIDTKSVFRYRIEWYMTIAMFHPRCVDRLSGIIAASGIA